MHDVMHAIVLYMTLSDYILHTAIVHLESDLTDAYVCMTQLSEDVKTSCVSYDHTSVIHSRVLLL